MKYFLAHHYSKPRPKRAVARKPKLLPSKQVTHPRVIPNSLSPPTVATPAPIVTQQNSHLPINNPPSNAEVIRDHSQALEEKDASFFFRVYKGPYNVDIKRDGERNWLYKKGDNIALVNKYVTVYLPPYSPLKGSFPPNQKILAISPSLEEAVLKSLSKHDGIFDVEYATKNDDLQTFAHERHNPQSSETKIFAFDIMEIDGKDIRKEPLSVRREILEQSINDNQRIEVDHMEVAQDRAEAEAVAKKYQKQGYEGGMIKPSAHRYDSSAWQLKEKRYATADAVILGIEQTKDYVNNGIPRAFLLGMKDGNKYKVIGKVGTGLSNNERRDIAKNLVPLSDKAARQDYTGEFENNFAYVKPTQVVEVGFAKVTPALRLREPRLIRARWDKGPAQSLLSQIA